MNEKYLHFLWKQKRLTTINLHTTKGYALTIKNFGVYNTDSGPDFSNGSIAFNDHVLHGNIEMHVNASDWRKHGHQNDPAYNNVILHVVYNYDEDVTVNGFVLPVLELKAMIDWEHYNSWSSRLQLNAPIPCEARLHEVSSGLVIKQLKLNTHERLKRKADEIEELHELCGSNVMELLFRVLFRAFGGKLNSLPFTELGLRISVLPYLRASTQTKEAIVFGLAGLLDTNVNDEYALKLKEDWQFQKYRMQLGEISPGALKFKGARPTGFPTLRLAQFVAFSERLDWSVSFWLLEPKEILHHFKNALIQTPNRYWKTNYHFGKKKWKPNSGALSPETAYSIIINAIVPFLFWYGRKSGNVILLSKAVELLELIPEEKNTVIDQWNQRAALQKNARFGQALLEQEKHLCQKRKCMECLIGKELLSHS